MFTGDASASETHDQSMLENGCKQVSIIPVAENTNAHRNTATGTKSCPTRFKVRRGFRRRRPTCACTAHLVSIRFKVRGGSRPEAQRVYVFQVLFQSALRFAVVSDYRKAADAGTEFRVSIRFEVRGGFRQGSCAPGTAGWPCFNPL